MKVETERLSNSSIVLGDLNAGLNCKISLEEKLVIFDAIN